MARAYIVTPEGAVTEGTVTDLKSMQTVVGGDIEYVGLPGGALYCNENGIAKGLSPNPVATSYAAARLAEVGREFYSRPGTAPTLLGTVFFAGPAGEDGDHRDCPEAVKAELIKVGGTV